jgi:hypothetical protein
VTREMQTYRLHFWANYRIYKSPVIWATSKFFWQWCVIIKMIISMDTVHCLGFFQTQCIGNMVFPSTGKKAGKVPTHLSPLQWLNVEHWTKKKILTRNLNSPGYLQSQIIFTQIIRHKQMCFHEYFCTLNPTTSTHIVHVTDNLHPTWCLQW